MKSPVPRLHRRASFDGALTPMIDVIFQLMIFFLCTAGFSKPEALLRARLPDVAGSQSRPSTNPSPTEPAVVKLRQEADRLFIELGDRRIDSLSDLQTQMRRLATLRKDTPVVLDVAPNVRLQHVVGVYDGCRSAGAAVIHFATDKIP